MSKFKPPFNDELDNIIKTASDQEIAWLSGYLWGIIGKKVTSNTLRPSDDNKTESTNPFKQITIVSASQTGNARNIAQELSNDIERLGLLVKHINASEYKFKKIADDNLLIIVTSTQGEGEPPEEALPFYKYLFSSKAPKLDKLNFAIFGLGDCSYVNFCQAGKDFDQRLAELGATRLLARVDADTDFHALSQQWRQAVVNKLNLSLASNIVDNATIDKKDNISVENGLYSRNNPYIAMVNVNQRITGKDSDKDIRHIELDLTDSGIKYQAGDTLGVWYENSATLVNQFLTVTKLDENANIKLNGQTLLLKQALQQKLELTQNTPSVVEKYARLIQDQILIELIDNKSALFDFCKTTPFIDMLQHYTGTFDEQQFVDILRPLSPRFYSIASAQDEVGEEAHLTVNLVQYTVDNKIHYGGASRFLVDQIPEQSQIKIFIEYNDNFRLPDDNSVPIIMIGAGTGIAPFRAFLQQRASESATGLNWLFFGNPHFTSDFLYQVEWQNYVKSGLLSRIDLAWSRDQTHKIYIQNKILEQAMDIWQWLQQGAYIYVCGDANRMAKDVHSALKQIIIKQGQYSDEQANNYLDELRVNKRYQRDIY